MDKVELIWQMGLASLSETDNELRLPLILSNGLSRGQIRLLESYLSEHLNGAAVISFKDLDMGVYRILRRPEMQKTGNSPVTTPGSSSSAVSTFSGSPKNKTSDLKTQAQSKKTRIPRPPNAFILYRQKHHPLLKAKDPGLHNNEISIKLGNQWMHESPETRDKFKALAEELKRQHLLKYPGYQYTPRKASEKKQRMTARKLAKMQKQLELDSSDSATFDLPTFEPEMTDMEFELIDSNLPSHNAAMQARLVDVPSMEDMLDPIQPAPNPFASTDEMIDELNSIFPLQAATTAQPVPAPQPVAPNPAAMLAPPPPPIHNDNPPAPTTATAFLNSLIDWEGLNHDWAVVNEASIKASKRTQQVNAILSGPPRPLTEAERIAIDEEMTQAQALHG